MTTPDKPIPPASDRKVPEPVGGPTAPVVSTDESRKGPKTGGYDDRAPERTPDNAKGGYGAG